MNLQSATMIHGYGTPEGVTKSWDTRGRGRKEEERKPSSRQFTLPSGQRIDVSYDKHTQDIQLQSIRNTEMKRLPERVQDMLKSGRDTAEIYTKDGILIPERQDLHRQIIQQYLTGHQSQQNPEIILTGGGTASGKSTASSDARAALKDAVYVNPDDIRAMLPEYGAFVGGSMHQLNEEAGIIRDQIILAARTHDYNIVLDGVGSPQAAMQLDTAEASGYKVGYYYTHRPVEEAIPSSTNRAYTTDNLSDLRKVPEEGVRNAHMKARLSFPLIAKSNRELKLYSCCAPDKKEVAYWRDRNGQVRVYNGTRIDEVTNGGQEKIDRRLFSR